MKLRVIHETVYHYSPAVQNAQHMAHLRPRTGVVQRVLTHSLQVDPAPTQCNMVQDVFGNTRAFFSLPFTHEQLRVRAESLLETLPVPAAPPGEPWEAVRERLGYRRGQPYHAATEFSFASPYIPRHADFVAYAAESFAPGRPLMQAHRDIAGARVMGIFGDSITTDHISPAGNIKASSPAGKFLQARGVQPADFNSYGSRRGNDDVMVRGTFANIRIKNLMLGGEEGGNTIHYPSGEKLAIYDAAMKYKAEGVPLVVFAGKEYGTGSSRDWAAKGTNLLGVKAVVAESFERIHRSNLVGMGVLPCQFLEGQNAQTLGLKGDEVVSITGLEDGAAKLATVVAKRSDGTELRFQVQVLLLTPKEVEYFRHGGILHYVLRQLASRKAA